jgi:protein-tyrosine phosphatase
MFWRRPHAPKVYFLTDDIAIGPQPAAASLRSVREMGFVGVIDLREETPDTGTLTRAQRLNYMRAPITEGAAPTLDELYEVTGWITAHILEQGPVLVYCREGRGRSAMVAVASLVRLGLPLTEANNMLMRARPTAVISGRQMNALEAFAGSLGAKRVA